MVIIRLILLGLGATHTGQTEPHQCSVHGSCVFFTILWTLWWFHLDMSTISCNFMDRVVLKVEKSPVLIQPAPP